MDREDVVTVPDDESLLGDAQGPQLGAIDELPLDTRALINMYLTGFLLLFALLVLNFMSWRHYVKALSSVLLEHTGIGKPRNKDRGDV
jgi:hypothetical protein